MADFVLNATEVGEVVTYVAPGFLAQLGYRARFPAPEPDAGRVLIVSVVLSLPLVALANLMPGSHKPTQLLYVLALTAGAFVLGYVVACARGRDRVKGWLERFEYHIQPEGTIYAQTLRRMSAPGAVVIELKDGRRVWGTPRRGPEHKDDGINELYLTHPEAEWPDGTWQTVGAGLIVLLSEVSTIALSEDPTNAPTASPVVPAAPPTPQSAPGGVTPSP